MARANSRSFSSSVSVEASPVVPAITSPSEPWLSRWCISARRGFVDAQIRIEGVTIAVKIGPNTGHLQAPRGCGPAPDGQDDRMTNGPILTASDPRLDPFRGLRGTERRFLRPRRPEPRVACFVAEGGLVVARALGSGCAPLAILVDAAARARLAWADDPGLPVLAAERALIAQVTGLGVIREAIGIFARPPERSSGTVLDGAARVLVLEGVANPANLGAIIRSAAALGVDATLCDRTCADPLYRRAVRGSMGRCSRIPGRG